MVATQVRSFFAYIKGQRTDCLFCLASGMINRDSVVGQTPWAYLIVEYSQTVPGTYMIVPKRHREVLFRRGIHFWLDLLWGVGFWLSLLWLLRKVPWMGSSDYNLSINFGKDAGQTVPHIHVWFIPRSGAHAGRGLAFYVGREANTTS